MEVRIIRDYDYPNLFRQTPLEKGIWEGVIFTEDAINDCDYLIILNNTPKNVRVKKTEGGAWLFTQEPPLLSYKWHTNIFQYVDHVFTFWDYSFSPNIICEQTSLPWHINKNYDFLKSLNYNSLKKNDKVSWVTSNLTNRPGHLLRMAFKDYLITQNFDFDLFGRGFKPIEDKFDALAPYKYSIAIENYSCNGYWTEKIADCYLSWTMPIYYGCTDILNYFPEKSLILIDPSKPEESVKKIQKAIDIKIWDKNIDALQEARELVLEKYQLFPNIVSKIKQHQNRDFEKKFIKKNIFIPANNPPQKHGYISIIKQKLKQMFHL